MAAPETQVLSAVREIDFGTVEVVIHQSRITEIRQTRRRRFTEPGTDSAVPAPGFSQPQADRRSA